LINKKYGIYNIKFKTDSTDTVYINKKDITYYGDKDSSCCEILMTNDILSDVPPVIVPVLKRVSPDYRYTIFSHIAPEAGVPENCAA